MEEDEKGPDLAKQKRLQALMAETRTKFAREMLDDATIEKTRKLARAKLKSAGVGATLPYLKAFQAGYDLSSGTPSMDIEVMLGMALEAIIADEQQKVDEKVRAKLGE